MKAYDLIVVGAGPGGYEAAFEAADLGMKTALAEKEAPGGTCLNHGCIPTKSLLHAAGLYRAVTEAASFGIAAGDVTFDVKRMQEKKNEAVLTLRRGIEGTAARKRIDLFRGTGALTGGGRVTVSGESGTEELYAKHILIASGSRPFVPPIPGITLPGVVTSDEMLETERIPKRLVIIGGGVIGTEFAFLFSSLGSQVTVIEAMPQMLPGLDREIGQSVKMLLKKRGAEILTDARVREIREDGEGGLLCITEDDRSFPADTVTVCIGRRPCTEGLFGEGIGIETDRGRIVVDACGRTSLSGVYAAGDVTGGVMLAHAASAAGRNAVRHMAGLPPCADVRFIPSCIYTDPEIACVGLSAEEAKAKGIDADSRKVPMTANGRTVLTGAERGYMRAVYEKGTGRLLGAQLMCERASDIIGMFSQALSAGLTVGEAARAVLPHPTFCEAASELLRQCKP